MCIHHFIKIAKKQSIWLVLAGSLWACQNNNGDDRSVQDADTATNVDAFVDQSEYSENFSNSNAYDNWDRDHDTYLNETELGEGVFSSLDRNEDGYLSAEEWNVMGTFDETKFTAFNDVDENQDGRIDQTEFNNPIGNYELYQNWDFDQDGYINQEEFTGGMFDMWDVNSDGRLGPNEYGDWTSTMEEQ